MAVAYAVLLNVAIGFELATDRLEDVLWPFAAIAALGAGAAINRPSVVAKIVAVTAGVWLLGALLLLRGEALGYGLLFSGLICAMQIAGLAVGLFAFGIRSTAQRPTD